MRKFPPIFLAGAILLLVQRLLEQASDWINSLMTGETTGERRAYSCDGQGGRCFK